MGTIYSGSVPQHSSFAYFVRLVLILAVIAAIAWWVGDFGGNEVKLEIRHWFRGLLP